MHAADEYLTARNGAGLIDLGARGRIVVRGADRKTFLHALLTNDIALLAAGTGCYAALLTPQGRMIADMNVFELGDVMLDRCEARGQRPAAPALRPADLQRGRPARRCQRRLGLHRGVRAAGGGGGRRRDRRGPGRIQPFPERQARARGGTCSGGAPRCPGACRVSDLCGRRRHARNRAGVARGGSRPPAGGGCGGASRRGRRAGIPCRHGRRHDPARGRDRQNGRQLPERVLSRAGSAGEDQGPRARQGRRGSSWG